MGPNVCSKLQWTTPVSLPDLEGYPSTSQGQHQHHVNYSDPTEEYSDEAITLLTIQPSDGHQEALY